MAWALLLIAISTEVSGTLALTASAGFTQFWPSVIVVLGYGISFILLAQVLKTMGVGQTYAIWSGLGTMGTAVGGW